MLFTKTGIDNAKKCDIIKEEKEVRQWMELNLFVNDDKLRPVPAIALPMSTKRRKSPWKLIANKSGTKV